MTASGIDATVLPRFKPYLKYKDSGVEWLGKVPEQWGVERTKHVARLRSGHTPSRQHPEYWVDCAIPWFGLADVWQLRDGRQEYVVETNERISELGLANSAARLLPKGTVILSRTASVGFSAIMDTAMATTQDFVNWVCGERIRPEYLLYVFRSMQHEFRRLTMGSTHQTIYMPDVGKFLTPLPPVVEQDQIVAFVRTETAKIDALVANKERLIEVLQEKRTALITSAVTKGLDPNAPVNNSGVEWLGEIPAHWSTVRVRSILKRMEQGWSPECEARTASAEEWGVLKAGCVNGGSFVEDEHKALPKTLAPVRHLEIHVGDVLMSRASGSPELVESVAHVERCRPRLLLSDKIFRLHSDSSLVAGRFLAMALASRPVRAQIESTLSGGKGLANNIPQSTVKDLVVAIPPRRDQDIVLRFLDRNTTTIDALVTKVREGLDRLKEFRNLVISVAVTGKIDVRNVPGGRNGGVDGAR